MSEGEAIAAAVLETGFWLGSGRLRAWCRVLGNRGRRRRFRESRETGCGAVRTGVARTGKGAEDGERNGPWPV
jgi:hypothetical protein